jgi:hypothetical protein
MDQTIEYEASGYQPGVCNIGPAEIARRRHTGYVGVAGTLALGALLLALDAPPWTRLGVAVPLAMGLSGLIQARLHFCAGFGMAGLQNMGELGAQVRVEDDAARAADRRTAMRINALSIGGGFVAGLAFMLLPV